MTEAEHKQNSACS